MASIKPIAKGEDVRKNWHQINAMLRELETVRAETRRLSGAVDVLRAKLDRTGGGSGGTARWA